MLKIVLNFQQHLHHSPGLVNNQITAYGNLFLSFFSSQAGYRRYLNLFFLFFLLQAFGDLCIFDLLGSEYVAGGILMDTELNLDIQYSLKSI